MSVKDVTFWEAYDSGRLSRNAENDFVHEFNIYLTLEKDYQYKSGRLRNCIAPRC
jgi:hypothetical protein